MRKLLLASATLGILAAGAAGTAFADPSYRGHVYEGRNAYVGERYYGEPVYGPPVRTVPLGPSYGYEPSYADPWYMPGDQAIINQERANKRSER
ncbi:hypothetical protein [Ancylobacter sp. IITR112]|uniref:hypothetical protein n=1 Tax=Ancylobacter sp. IITR112 TaxID=3138073 RepID=UPI00352B184A